MKLTTMITVFATTVFLVACNRSPEPKQEFKTTDELIRYFSEEAVDIAAKNHGIALDYSTDSIEKVEEVLAKLHEEYLKQKPEKGVDGLAMAFGAYIGECIRKEVPTATWRTDHPVGGEKSYPLNWLGGDSFPCAWCYRRITEGPEDNVWHKYTVLRQQRNEQGGFAPDDAGK